MFKDITLGTIWVGEVFDLDDPLKIGRAKIRIFGKYDDLTEEVIPWSFPFNQLNSGTIIMPKIGDIVNVFFENGDENVPIYTSAVKPNDDLLGEIEGDFPKAWSIVYDNRMGEDGKGEESDARTLQIFYTETQGLIIKKNDSLFQIRNDDESIFITNGKSGDVIHMNDDGISIGSEGTSDEPAVLGDKNVDALTALADKIVALDGEVIKLHAQTTAINTLLTGFASAQTTAAGALPILAPLIPGYAAMTAGTGAIVGGLTPIAPAVTKITTEIESKVKKKTIPDTRSDKVTLDGPSKK